MPVAIAIRELVKTYPGRPPVQAVCGLSLEVPEGQCFGLLGPNGAGKTTTLEIVEGLLEPTRGEVEVLGLRWDRDEARIRSRIGISLQETRLPDKLRVREVVALFRSFYPTGLAVNDAVAAVSLHEKATSKVDSLSGGQKQRLAVACALVGDPDLLFLDEPTTGLDPQSRRELWEVIRRFKDRGRTVVLTTHYMDEAERLCDRVAVIDHGKVIADGSPAELVRKIGGEHVLTLTLDRGNGQSLDPTELARLPGVTAARRENDGSYTLSAGEPQTALPAALELVRTKGLPLAGLTTRTATLEDVFVALTGRHLRDDSSN